MNCPQLVMYEGFYCAHGTEYYMPRAHELKEYCYDGSHEQRCGRCADAMTGKAKPAGVLNDRAA